jgi:hypothetical protein
VEKQNRSVSIHWIGRRPEDALGAAVHPNYEA